MTSGPLAVHILLFSLPLMMSQILEGLFNLSDVAIAGKFADYRALGSVGSTTRLGTKDELIDGAVLSKIYALGNARHDCFYRTCCKDCIIPP